nr:type II toxin-antitoxin system antitoxin SocA domain-containing protein [uncultured Marinifilum sp.]
MFPKVDIKQLSHYLIDFFRYKEDVITNKKLQKLLYYIQAWHLVYFDGALLFDDQPQAWVHGPVYSDIYHEYKHNNGRPLSNSDDEITLDELNAQLHMLELTDQQNEFLDECLKYYGTKTAFQLEVMTHTEDPWVEARRGYGANEPSTREISIDTMRNYYSKLQNA